MPAARGERIEVRIGQRRYIACVFRLLSSPNESLLREMPKVQFVINAIEPPELVSEVQEITCTFPSGDTLSFTAFLTQVTGSRHRYILEFKLVVPPTFTSFRTYEEPQEARTEISMSDLIALLGGPSATTARFTSEGGFSLN